VDPLAFRTISQRSLDERSVSNRLYLRATTTTASENLLSLNFLCGRDLVEPLSRHADLLGSRPSLTRRQSQIVRFPRFFC